MVSCASLSGNYGEKAAAEYVAATPGRPGASVVVTVATTSLPVPEFLSISEVSQLSLPPQICSLQQARNRSSIDAIGAGDQRLTFASFQSGQGFTLLEGVELARPSELHLIINCPL
jgi:hypothetical protein